MKVKKVLHILATGKLSGAEKVVSDICTNLDERYEPIIVCSGDPLKQYYEEKGIKTYEADISKLNPKQIKRIKEIVESEQIDIIHGHDIKASIAGYLASGKSKIPTISHMHVTYLWMKKFGPFKVMDAWFRNKYSLSIACSEAVKDYYLQYNSKADKDKVIFMDNCFNFNEFNKVVLEDRNEFKAKIGIKNDQYVFGYLGRLLKVKGAELMIEAFKSKMDLMDKAILLIVGDGEEKDNLEDLVKQYGIEERVIFAGYQKKSYDYMNTFDSFILPSVREGLPIAVLEAMAMKKPVISTPVAGLSKLMKSGFNGIVLEERTKEALANAMESLYNDNELSQKIADNAYKHLYENCNINNYVDRLQDIYNNM